MIGQVFPSYGAAAQFAKRRGFAVWRHVTSGNWIAGPRRFSNAKEA